MSRTEFAYGAFDVAMFAFLLHRLFLFAQRDRYEPKAERRMIGRLWHGWTNRENADPYEELVRTGILPGFHRVEGYKGAYLLRKNDDGETEFVALTLFENIEAVRKFAGKDCGAPVVPPEARRLLCRFDQSAAHYEIVFPTREKA